MYNNNKILIVDDVKENVLLLKTILKKYFYRELEIFTALNGSSAIELANKHNPDIILLDIMMPEMDGFEVCSKLKLSDKTKKIPIIFLTALTDIESKLKAFKVGGIDYILKPFSKEEVFHRVNIHLNLKILTDNLEEQVNLKTQQVLHSEKLSTIGTMAASIIHEINNPLTVLKLNNELFQKQIKKRLDTDENIKKNDELIELFNTFSELLELNTDSINKVNDIIKSLKSLSNKNETLKDKIEKFYLNDFLEENIYLISKLVSKRNAIEQIFEDENILVETNKNSLTQVFVNIFQNAIHSLEKVNGKTFVKVICYKKEDFAIIKIQDNGSGISEENLSKIWDSFYTTKPASKGTGLGLFVVKQICEKLNIDISVESKVNVGTTFTLKIKCIDSELNN